MLDRKEYDRFRVGPADPAELRSRDVERILQRLAQGSAGALRVEKWADSCEGRPIHLARIGTGVKRILLWSQMHGDEPTHTTVLLDLASFLLQLPNDPRAAAILRNCTLHFIPMLNPDGAEAVTRFNAQGIDINRDARRLATPEGRALRRAVETIRPEFGFNLHNQNARTTVGQPPRPAAVSVLAPAPDKLGRETPSWRRAKLMCSFFVETVRPLVPGMISRYDDTHEPRAFGDTIQAIGASTMLVEAGGWPENDIEPLTRVHFHGILNTLHAIATDEDLRADLNVYDSLPNSNATRPVDTMLLRPRILGGGAAEPFVADLAIEHTNTTRLGDGEKSDGRIMDVGDVVQLPARVAVAAHDWLVVPGTLAYLAEWNPTEALSPEAVSTLLARGATTVVGRVDLEHREQVNAVDRERELPFHWGFVGELKEAAALERVEVLEQLAAAVHRGLLAVVTDRANEAAWSRVARFGLPLVPPNHLPVAGSRRETYLDLVTKAARAYKLLNLFGPRGRVGREAVADLAAFAVAEAGGAQVGIVNAMPVAWEKLVRVFVGGETVWQDGQRRGGSPGRLLRRNA